MHSNDELKTIAESIDSEQNQQFDYNDLSRREVRSLVFHLLYAMEGFNYDTNLQSIVDNFNKGFDLNIPFDGDLTTKAQSVIDNRDALDEIIKPLLHNWRFDRLGVVTKLILRFSLWELERTKTPSTVVINEAVELAKCFAEKDAYKFINGLLDEHAKKTNRA